ncbi:ABC transporter ATP-binding protein [Dongia sedimenti]|uniref:Spermidine/putrescine import ATP-binding protein PotA n=1 Tax=Dongia sedimenti TaxID=3064282 RepID=A0ABU0YKL2_9PROT|nr:ABC transporter ATP-binding protein [Rhodospirillaceae bacterium R-7]
MSQVEVVGCTKRYGAIAALDNVSLKFVEGELFGLLGPSGSGKTTLLRAVAGFIDLDHGQVLLDGEDIGPIPVHKRDIGMVFQNYALFPHMTVFDNVAFGLSVRKMPAGEIKSRVDEILGLVRLGGLQERKPKQLSGGQQQRVALARALVTRPKVLLLDEPLGALDKHLREEMQVELRRIQREVGITTIFVTHDQEEAMTLSDRIAIMNQGRIEQLGPPLDVYEHPINRFAAGFLGVANFLEGRVVSVSGNEARIDLKLGGQAVAPADGYRAGDSAVLAVRPEKIGVDAGGRSAGVNQLSGKVIGAVFSGSSTTYRVQVDDQVISVFQQNSTPRRFQPDDPVTLHWSPEHNVPVAP